MDFYPQALFFALSQVRIARTTKPGAVPLPFYERNGGDLYAHIVRLTQRSPGSESV